MFSLQIKKSLMSAAAAVFAVSVGFGTSAAYALTCPDPAASTVLRLLDISTTPAGNVSSISCLASGTDAGADGSFQTLFPTYSFIGKEENKPLSGNEGAGALNGFLDEVGGSSFWSGNQGEFTFTDPNTDDAYAILFKFGKPELSESWFAIKVAGGLAAFNIIWQSVDENGELRRGQELSHVTLYGVPAPIPVPAAGILLATALCGLGVTARRRRKST